MPIHSLCLQQSTIRFLWNGILAASILYLLAAWNSGNNAEHINTVDSHKRAIVAADTPLQVSTEHSLRLQRFFNHALSRIKDQPISIEPPTPIWGLATTEIVPSLLLATANQPNPFCIADVVQQQLHTLNIPRAPPLV